jgi:acyl-coenzyme A thioesterase PaaI-like protein
MHRQHRVHAKQPNSKMCLVCGLENAAGLQAAFYELEGGLVVAVFTPRDQHQGYPGRLHGGVAAAVLDETIGRAIRLRHGDELWGVTIELSTRFRQPVPLNEPLRVVGRITQESRRHFSGTGEILLAGGSVAVEAAGRYLKYPLDKISDFDFEHQQWRVVPAECDPPQIELPARIDPAAD